MKSLSIPTFVISLTALIFLSLPAPAPLCSANARSDLTSSVPVFDRLPPGLAYALASALQDKVPPAYHIHREGLGFVAGNPAHEMSAVFTDKGFLLTDHTGNWNWSMKLTGWGRSGTVRPARQVSPVAVGARLEYSRGPSLKEWYLNTAWGLEQCFTVTHRPPITPGKPSPLVLDFALSGTLRPDLQADTLILRDTHGRTILQYGGLYAFDAEGRALCSSFVLADETLRIRVDDAAARYPITIDPWVQRAKLTASGGAAEDYFGGSVAIDGDTVVVGARSHDVGTTGDAGAAYVFEKPAAGWATTSTYAAKLTASGGAQSDQFGNSVAVSGNTVVVGAHYADSDYGAAYVFQKPLIGGWQDTSEAAKLTASDRSWTDWFGTSVAIDGDTVVVGAVGKDTSTGAAYVFVKGTGLFWTDKTETAKLTASGGAIYYYFGQSVAISGETVVVGEPFRDTQTGAAYVFQKPIIGDWQDTSTAAKLTAGDGATYDHFGESVAISGDTVVVGAYLDTVGTNTGQGSAYVFEKPVGGWVTTSTHNAKLTAGDGAISDQFGFSAAISGETVVVGARFNAVEGMESRGSAYMYKKPAAGWTTTSHAHTKLIAGDGAAHDRFGYSVAISGDTVVVGAQSDTVGTNTDQGSAYVFPYNGYCPSTLLLLLN